MALLGTPAVAAPAPSRCATLVCDDGDPCTPDFCDEATGCGAGPADAWCRLPEIYPLIATAPHEAIPSRRLARCLLRLAGRTAPLWWHLRAPVTKRSQRTVERARRALRTLARVVARAARRECIDSGLATRILELACPIGPGSSSGVCQAWLLGPLPRRAGRGYPSGPWTTSASPTSAGTRSGSSRSTDPSG